MISTPAPIRSGVIRSSTSSAAVVIPNTGTSRENGAITDAE